MSFLLLKTYVAVPAGVSIIEVIFKKTKRFIDVHWVCEHEFSRKPFSISPIVSLKASSSLSTLHSFLNFFLLRIVWLI